MSWLGRAAWAARPAAVERGSRALAALVNGALDAWREELASCGASHLLRANGSYVVYDTPPTYQRAKAVRRGARAQGVAFTPLLGSEVAERLPALGSVYRGIHYPDNAHVLSPRGVVDALADAFVGAGGELEQRRVLSIARANDGVEVRIDAGARPHSAAVVAAGWQSRGLCEPFMRVPLAVEMGYHVSFRMPDAGLPAPVMVAARSFMVTPMEEELRIAGTVEFARGEEPPDWRRAEALEQHARHLFRVPLGEVLQRWRGSRPTLPDFLPAIGAISPGAPIYAAFGHQHIGLTTAVVTGRLIADLVAGQAPRIDVAPYDPQRFRS